MTTVEGRPGPVLLALACAWSAFMPIGGKYVGYVGCGLAALVGEVACITMALIVAPVCLAVLRRREDRHKSGR